MRMRVSIAIASAILTMGFLAVPMEAAAADSPTFLISPTSLDFGNVLVGSTSSKLSVTVTNVSNAPVIMNGQNFETSPIIVTNDCQGKTLLVGGRCHMLYQYAPTQIGTTTEVSGDTWNGQSYQMHLTGVGVTQFEYSAAALDFGDIPIGTTAPSQSVTVTNLSAPTQINISGGAATGFGGAQDCQGRTLGTGESCHLFYAFAPNALGTATTTATGHFNGQPFSVGLTGNGVPLPSGDFIPVPPARVLDTRSLAVHPSPNEKIPFAVAGFTAAPKSAVAVDVTVNVFPQGTSGSLIVWDCGSQLPPHPTMRFHANTPIATHVQATFGVNGVACIQATQSADFAVDLNGYYSSTGSLQPIAPTAVEDTTSGARPTAGTVLQIPVIGGAVPVDASAVALNVTALNQAHSGHLTVFPCGITAPNTSALQFAAHRPESALAVSAVGSGGKVCVQTSTGSDVHADVTAYYKPGSSFTAVTPKRVLDTAAHVGFSGGKPAANQIVRATAVGGTIPSTASAVVMDVTASSEAKAGTLTVYSCDQARPSNATLQFQPNDPVTNLTVTREILGSKVCIRSTRSTHIAVDVVGWYA